MIKVESTPLYLPSQPQITRRGFLARAVFVPAAASGLAAACSPEQGWQTEAIFEGTVTVKRSDKIIRRTPQYPDKADNLVNWDNISFNIDNDGIINLKDNQIFIIKNPIIVYGQHNQESILPSPWIRFDARIKGLFSVPTALYINTEEKTAAIIMDPHGRYKDSRSGEKLPTGLGVITLP